MQSKLLEARRVLECCAELVKDELICEICDAPALRFACELSTPSVGHLMRFLLSAPPYCERMQQLQLWYRTQACC